MILNYIKSSVRNFKKGWLFTIINISGLSVGLASFLLLSGYTQFEETYDNFHSNENSTYRLIFERYKGGEIKSKSPFVMPGLGNRIKEHIPEVALVTRFTSDQNGSVVKTKELVSEVSNLFYIDNDFLNLLSFKLIEGDQNTALKKPNSIVLTESTAKLFFGNSSAIDKEIEVTDSYGKQKYNVTGVIQDPPKNTYFDFGYLCSFNSIFSGQKWFENNWSWYGFETFIGLNTGKNLEDVKRQFLDFISKYKTDPNEADKEWKFSFQPLSDIHLNSDFTNLGVNQNKKQKVISLLKIISILIMLISWVNYINLSTAKSVERAREIGIRKSLGAYKKQITHQFLIEALLINIFSIFLGLLIVFIVAKPFFSFLGLNYNYEIFNNLSFWFSVVIIFIISVISSGIYPALVASRFKSTEVLKTKSLSTNSSSILRKVLVGVQFLISIVLIICTSIIINQNNFLKDKDIGILTDNVLIVPSPKVLDKTKLKEKYKSFVAELLKTKNIESVSASFAIPSVGSWGLAIKESSKSDSERLNHTVIGIDNYYVPTYNVQILSGRNFRETDLNKDVVLISLESMKLLNITSPEVALGKKIKIETFDKKEFEIIGVMKDYHHSSVQNEISTMVFLPNGEEGLFSVPRYFSIKTNSNISIQNLKEEVKNVYDNFFNDDIFEINILDDKITAQYEEEERNQNVFTIFSSLAIFLSVFGIFGLSSFIASSKEKEIAIRKVLGSRVNNTLWILSKEFVMIFAIVAIISIPIVNYFMGEWLLNFPYRISVTPIFFLKSFSIIILLTILIIAFNLIKSFNKTPISVLKEE